MQNASYNDIVFDDEPAWQSFLQAHGQDHEQWSETTTDAGLSIQNYPLVEWDEPLGWLERHQRVHEQVAEAWATDAPPNLQDWDLEDARQFAFWTVVHAQEHARMNAIMGLT